MGDINRGETMTMAPLVVKNNVLVGNSGGEFGVRGWLTALDVPGATALVAPSLDKIGSRMYIAGRLPNTPENMLK